MKISIYITSYNQKNYLAEAIESVLNQTFRPFEIIIVDDCSSDGSQELIAGYTSRYPGLIKPIFHDQNKGITQTRIDALQVISGDYVTYLDGDDRFFPTKLEEESKLLQDNPGTQIAFSNYYYITSEGDRFGLWADGDSKVPQGNIFLQTFARDFPRRNLFRNELVDFRAWRRVGFYDSALHLYEDYEMRIRLTKNLRAVYNGKPLVEYRIHERGLSKTDAWQHLMALEYIWRKNKSLLDDLSDAQRKQVERMLHEWMARVARQAANQLLAENQYQLKNRMLAFKYYFKAFAYYPRQFDYKFVIKILLPYSVYEKLGSTYRLRGDVVSKS